MTGEGRRDAAGTGADGIATEPICAQPPLPTLRPFINRTTAEFAHPVERDFARLLNYYRVRWSYEPTAFALAWTEDGHPAEMFTPDFYLPEQQLYIELTTMRQRLVTRKNRKLRRLRELYPNVRIKLLYRRDCRRLAECYRSSTRSADAGQLGHMLYPAETIRARVAALADEIARDTLGLAAPPDRLLVLSVGRGSLRFASMLVKELRGRGIPIDRDRIELTRYRTTVGRCGVRVRRPPETALRDARVLVVEDIVSTGLSLKYLVRWLRRHGACQIDICSLLDRTVARLVEVPIRYVGFEAPNQVLVGFGLNLRRQFRDLPFIATLELPPDAPFDAG